ncbi:AbrB/MazE/SpoVT family DNA-binding domain-containing protein [Roseococcus microcysteis]|uniref:AbrB/MazE/SpoVT family DNA-binding domain-containing protein n=1 Tax=Roseococcus microcysteis TaxID=2771361 RepID=UPI00168B1F3C|nr:AbrB/MazE/SpoVT family DNA-binding domain-containing protein [Roseococcus microcysteis]
MLAKLTAKNQLTLPKRVVDALGNPTHFEIQVHKGALILWPGRVVSLERQAETAGIPPEVLREAQRLLAERKAREKTGAL